MTQETTRDRIASLALEIYHYNQTSKRERPKRLKMMEKISKEFKDMIRQDDFYSFDISVELTKTMLELMPIAEALYASATLATQADEKLNGEDNVVPEALKNLAKNRVATASFSQDAGLIVTCVRSAPEAIREEFMNHTLDILATTAGMSPDKFREELNKRKYKIG